MLKHKGVQGWIERRDQYPVPNRFLGITPANRSRYEALSLAGKCAARWLSHRRRLEALARALPDRVRVVEYERMQTETAEELEALRAFLGLEAAFPVPDIRRESLDRWRAELDADAVAEIEAVVEGFPLDGLDLGVGDELREERESSPRART